ncbi:AraC family transcriptional regulator [Paraburkholderia sp. BCC1886]|uniref:AraC family transcriptional regulator n=1 Tax=Paraburkholderia sp. BCC1886 TaxID=2562670 RepID=UPI001181D432|nr:AraC family transcriptional regulator [Paraburkholderia sp. BCC1886]
MNETVAHKSKSSLTRFVRGAMLTGLETASREIGFDCAALLNETNLSLDWSTHPDMLLPADSVNRLLELGAQRTGWSDFGFRASLARGLPDLGMLTLLLREEATLGDAMGTLAENIHLHGNSTFIQTDAHTPRPIVSFRIATSVAGVQATEFCGCGLVMLIRWLVGPEWNPVAMCFSHSKPAHTTLQQRFYRSELNYDQLISGVIFSRADWNRRISSVPEVLRRRARELIAFEAKGTAPTFEEEVGRVITRLLPEDCCTVESVSAELGIDRRTLSRRLQQKGLSYSSLLNQVRSEIAILQLSGGSLPLTDVAQAVGFSSLSTFSRWFQQSFGCSATRWREDDRHYAVSSRRYTR